MKLHWTVLISLCATLLLAASSYAAQMSCETCHSDKATGKSVHAAVSKGCKVCHIGVDASNIPHNFFGSEKGLPTADAALCYSCHEKKLFITRHVVHQPVRSGMCTFCHDAHASPYRPLLRSQDLCFNCHDKAGFTSEANVHAPVAGGMCLSCHLPHNSRSEKLLRTKQPALCFSCHEKGIFSGANIHVPIALGMCSECHFPHQSKYGSLARIEAREMCLKCHEEGKVAQNPAHQPVDQAQCLICHQPHVSSGASLLR